MQLQRWLTCWLFLIFGGFLEGKDTKEDERMSKQHAKCINPLSAQCDDLLANIVTTFITSMTAESGWWCRMPTHPKGSKCRTNDLFPHFGTALGLRDHVMAELFVAIKTTKRRPNGHQTNAHA